MSKIVTGHHGKTFHVALLGTALAAAAPANASTADQPPAPTPMSTQAQLADPQQAAQSQPGVSTGNAAANPVAPVPTTSSLTSASAARATALDAVYQVKGFDNPYYSFGQTITLDNGHWRSKLADAGFSLVVASINIFATPLNRAAPRGAAQSFWGQKPSLYDLSFFDLMWDASKIGIEGGQFQVSMASNRSTYEPFQPNTFAASRFAYFQSLDHGKVELIAGLITNGQGFIGMNVGGNAYSPLGPSAIIPYQVGLSAAPAPAPTFMIKNNWSSGLYNQFAVQRSLPPLPGVFLANARENPHGFKFSLPGAKALFIDEIGFRHFAAPGRKYIWVRLGGIYNTSEFKSYVNPAERHKNYAVYLLADKQVTQNDGTSKATAAQGLYLGGSVMYAPANVNAVSQYYEGRAYYKGPFETRQKDQVALVVTHQKFSHDLVDNLDAVTPINGSFGEPGSTTVTPTYTAYVSHGIFATFGGSYIDHPKLARAPGEKSSFQFLTVLFFSL